VRVPRVVGDVVVDERDDVLLGHTMVAEDVIRVRHVGLVPIITPSIGSSDQHGVDFGRGARFVRRQDKQPGPEVNHPGRSEHGHQHGHDEEAAS